MASGSAWRRLAILCLTAALVALPPLLGHASSAYTILRIHLEVTAACRIDYLADAGIAAVHARCSAGAPPPSLTEIRAPAVVPPALLRVDERYRLVSIVF